MAVGLLSAMIQAIQEVDIIIYSEALIFRGSAFLPFLVVMDI